MVCPPSAVINTDSEKYICISAQNGDGIDKLAELLENIVHEGTTKATFFIPNSEQGALNRLYSDATIESIEKIATALNLPMSKLFEQLGGQDDGSRNIPLAFYEFLSAKTPNEQEQLFKILMEMDKYRSK